MLVVNLPVQACIAIQTLTLIDAHEVAVVLYYMLCVCNLFQFTVLTRSVSAIVYTSKQVNTTSSVVHVEGSRGVIALAPLQRLGICCVEVEAKALALSLDSADANHTPDGSIILSTWVANHLHALDFVTLQAI